MILASATPTVLTLTLVSAVAYALSVTPAVRTRSGLWQVAILTGWLAQGFTLALTLWGDGLVQPARFGFAPALSVTSWLVTAVYVVELRIFPKLQGRWFLGALGAATVVLSRVFPGAALAEHAPAWFPLHLALGVASYGLFAVAVLHAWLMTRADAHIRHAAQPHTGLPLLTLERLTFRFVEAGFILLSATLMVAWVLGASMNGGHAGWKWDHKTLFSVLSWGTFAGLLLGRARLGWRGKRAIRVLYVGAGLLLLAYVGSRFVLEVVLGRVT